MQIAKIEMEKEKATSKGKKRSRENTMEEKRRMRKKRKCVQSSTCRQISTLKAEADLKQRLLEDSEKKRIRYRMMARSYWERWDRELHERKEAIRKRKNHQARVAHLLEIDPSLLHDPESANSEILRTYLRPPTQVPAPVRPALGWPATCIYVRVRGGLRMQFGGRIETL